MRTRLCGYPGCNRLTAGDYFCTEHRQQYEHKRKREAFKTATRSALYQSPEWKALSRELIKEKGYCEKCGERMNLQVHHIIPVRLAPQLALDRSNLQVLCRLCHQRETAKEINGRRKR